eukprot:gnl/Chilomastix_cuspidata/141.p2 GENE.gnl/Chilomastix_cuspidata/141~~gnl/Chilomastix_cuspidata/141.p2  ORF type:complete len:834 (-),score=431.11 gnl/Chilomastix_cuspidata/141:23-2524(-)
MIRIARKDTEPVSFKKSVGEFIKKTYSKSELEKVAPALEDLDRLRRNAIGANTPKEESIEKIEAYLRRVDYLAHFPLSNRAIRIAFDWKSSINRREHFSASTPEAEKMCFFFNMACLLIDIASRCDSTKVEGLKQANKFLARAAGCFTVCKEMSLVKTFPTTVDLSAEFLDVLILLCVAQGQECIWMTSVINEMRDTIIASVAVFIAETYDRLLALSSLKQFKRKIPKEWINIFNFKALALHAEAHFRAGMNDEAAGSHGIAVAQLTHAQALCDRAFDKFNHGIPPNFISFFQRYTYSVIRRQLPGLEKDNRLIYYQKVPAGPQSVPASKKLTKVEMPTVAFASVNDAEDPFKELIPKDVQALLESYTSQADQKLQEVLAPVLKLTGDIQAAMGEMKLPQSLWAFLPKDDASDAPSASAGPTIPTSMAAALDQIVASGGIAFVLSKNDEINKMGEEAKGIMAGAVPQLRNLLVQDNSNLSRFGARWDSSPFRSVYDNYIRELDTLSTKLGQAMSADLLVKQKIGAYQPSISAAEKIANARTAEPTATAKETPVVRAARAVKEVIDSIQTFQAKVEALEMEIKQMRGADSPIEDLLPCRGKREDSAAVKEVFAHNLAKYNAFGERVRALAGELGAILDKLRAKNSEFVSVRSTAPNALRQGEQVAQAETGLAAFNDLKQLLETGERFYSEFLGRARTLQKRSANFVASYTQEAAMAIQQLSMGSVPSVVITGMGVSHNPPPPGGAPGGGAPQPPRGMPPQGMPPQGMPPHGMPPQGMPPQGMPPHGMPPQGYYGQGAPPGYQYYGQQPPPGYAPQGGPAPPGYNAAFRRPGGQQ